jgi:GDP-L-fucose synthase
MPALIRKILDAKSNNLHKVVLWGSGSPIREFLHTDDLARAVLLCLEKYNDPQHINIGSGIEISIKNLALKISNQVEYNGEIIWDKTLPDGTPRKVLDATKISKLGWKPNISLDQGIRSTIDWYLENRVGPSV